MPPLKFTVDAALLRELGERLVGQPHIALAELIKNSYDADATHVVVTFGADSIEVVDNGHGMDLDSFRGYWMRIGSPHKSAQGVSPELGRALTGSKGVGRLAAQFLADEIELITAASPDGPTLRATVDWDDAVQAKELTRAIANVQYNAKPVAYALDSPTGTRLKLTGLRQMWDADTLNGLAQELWPLRPPFGGDAEDSDSFDVELHTGDTAAMAEFEFQMSAVLRLWEARITGTVTDVAPTSEEDRHDDDEAEPTSRREVRVVVNFDDGTREPLNIGLPLTYLHDLKFEIRVFRLTNRQRFGIPVEEARKYFRRFGGVHLYDAKFHLPFYGPDTDWLEIEQDHSHRLSTSKLLPEEFQVDRGLNFLPTNSRIYGVVTVDTGNERRSAEADGRSARQALTIGIGRDRLIDNAAYRELVSVVRTAVDFYAMRVAARAAKASTDRGPSGVLLTTEARTLEDVVEAIAQDLDDADRERLLTAATHVSAAADAEAAKVARQASLLGALATAGIAAVAYEHEASRQLRELDRVTRSLARLGPGGEKAADELSQWADRARATRALFTPLMDEENREELRSMRARAVLEQVAEQTRPLLRGMTVDLDDVDSDLRLPSGRFAEWSALWQNVFINAANAATSSGDGRLKATSNSRGRNTWIVILDSGMGMDLDDAERFFEPFERGVAVGRSRSRGLGAGGSGLGLTIVRMIARNMRCEARFVAPPTDGDWTTAFQLSWRTA